jgi:putative nucleotidyltransferase with HDIG domain
VDAPRRWIALVARTMRAFVPVLARPDDAFAASWLDPAELSLYRTMDRRDRDHACRVARRLLRDHAQAEPTWVRAALLHDVGKASAPYRPLERIVVHVVRPGTAVAVRLPRPWSEAVERQRLHADAGARLVRAAGGDERVAALVAGHHAPDDQEPGAQAIALADGRSG